MPALTNPLFERIKLISPIINPHSYGLRKIHLARTNFLGDPLMVTRYFTRPTPFPKFVSLTYPPSSDQLMRSSELPTTRSMLR